MYLLPIFIFFIYVYLEISIFVAVANTIGVFLALIGIIATSMIGLSLVKSHGLKNFALMQQKIANNENPTDELARSVSLLFAGFLLLIPGFLTDILGVLLLFPILQYFIRYLTPKMNFKTYHYRHHYRSQQNTNNDNMSNNIANNSDIIEGEFRRKNDE